MPNILIVDINQDSGCLLRGVLRNYYGVSMSDTAGEAMSKIETALFDSVVIDAPKANSEITKLVGNIKKVVPHLPIIGLMDEETAQPGFNAILAHPFNALKLLKTVRDGLRNTSGEKCLHREITYNTEICAGKDSSETIKCRLINLSFNGMLIENFIPAIGGDARKEKEKFHSFFSRYAESKHTKLTASLLLKQDSALRLKSHIVFIDKEATEQIRNIGLGFDDLKQDERQAIETLISAQAA